MNRIKKSILGIALVSSAIGFSQNSKPLSMKNMLKLGVNAGYSVPSTNAGMSVGADITYQYLVTPHFGLGVATGHTYYFGKENTVNNVKIENNDFGIVPVAALVRYYPAKKGIYFGADLGYSFITGNKYVADNFSVERPTGGAYIKPEIGYHNRNWNVALQYQKVFTGNSGEILSQDYNVGSLGLGVNYNIPLGKKVKK
ncbi:hypothetical protein AB4865_10105 [Capnocytophaga sp. ARDL2]|uniref:hypothetical protein n=1 Tax=Capnocytophaga sp. ARDL2 TaxID=3238809 RepID=UPI003557C73E